MVKNYIPITEYQLPDGKQVQREIARPREIADKAHAIIAQGNRFEMERLQTGDVSLTIFNVEKEEDVDIVLCFYQIKKRKLLECFDKLVTDYWNKHSFRPATKDEAMT